jgi:Ca-activated chloride channel family protein
MKSPRKTAAFACIFLLFAQSILPSVQSPQASPSQSPPQNDAQAKIRVSSNLVVLPVTVKDSSGELVPDLHRDEFRIFEDDVEQNIDVFSAEAFPLSLVVLIDNDLKDKDAEQVRASLESIVAGLSETDEAFVCRFDQFFHPGQGFTPDQDKLVAELKRTKLDTEPSVGPPGGPFRGPSINNHPVDTRPSADPGVQIVGAQPTKALDDAVFAAAQLLHDRGRDRRKVILLISDGVNGGKKFNAVSYDDVVKALLRENITVYSVAVASAYLERKLSRLIGYAKATGGEMFFSAKRESLEKLYSRVTEEARNQYTLGYVPRGTDRSAEFHSVEVRVKREGLTVKTRDRYYTGAMPVPASR